MDRESILEPISLFEEKLEGYRSYHQHEINVALHVIGIPDIILALFVVAVAGFASSVFFVSVVSNFLAVALVTLLVFHFGWGGWRGIGAALLGVICFVLAYSGLVVEYFWVWLILEGAFFSIMMIVGGFARQGVSRKHDRIALVLGVGTFLALVSFIWWGPDMNTLEVSPWVAALALFVMGFYYHVPGHKLFEGNRPALLDDITQSFLAAPQEIVDVVVRSAKTLIP